MVGRGESGYPLHRFADFRRTAIVLDGAIPTALAVAEEHVLR